MCLSVTQNCSPCLLNSCPNLPHTRLLQHTTRKIVVQRDVENTSEVEGFSIFFLLYLLAWISLQVKGFPPQLIFIFFKLVYSYFLSVCGLKL